MEFRHTGDERGWGLTEHLSQIFGYGVFCGSDRDAVKPIRIVDDLGGASLG